MDPGIVGAGLIARQEVGRECPLVVPAVQLVGHPLHVRPYTGSASPPPASHQREGGALPLQATVSPHDCRRGRRGTNYNMERVTNRKP